MLESRPYQGLFLETRAVPFHYLLIPYTVLGTYFSARWGALGAIKGAPSGSETLVVTMGG